MHGGKNMALGIVGTAVGKGKGAQLENREMDDLVRF
jgi:hypothetical protein